MNDYPCKNPPSPPYMQNEHHLLSAGVACASPHNFFHRSFVYFYIHIQPTSPTYMQNKSPPPISGGSPA